MLRSALAVCLILAGCSPSEQAVEEEVSQEGTDTGVAAAVPANVPAPDGVTIHYEDQGKGEVALVFVHGWSCDRSYWNAQRDHFAANYLVVTVDLAGHGESGDNRDQFTMHAFGADVAAVITALDLSNVVLVGHSMGGPVVLAAGNRLKGRVAAVVGVDTLRDISQRRTPAEIDERVARLDADFVGDTRRVVSDMFVAQSDPTLKDWVVDDMASAPPRVAKSAMRGMSAYDARAGIAGLGVPLALINSDYRPNNPAPVAAAAQSFTYIEMSDVGHFVMMEDPETFNRHLEEIIESLAL